MGTISYVGALIRDRVLNRDRAHLFFEKQLNVQNKTLIYLFKKEQ